MHLKTTLALLSAIACTTLTAEKEPVVYYEDYLRSLQAEDYETIAEEEESVPEEETDAEEEQFYYYDDYLRSQQAAQEEDEAPEIADTMPLVIPATASGSHEPAPLDMFKLSEAFGNFLGKNLKNSGIEFDENSLVMGMRKGLKGLPSPMTDQEYEAAMMQAQVKAFERVSSDNLQKAEEFLQQNGQRSGVKQIVPEKLQYEVLQRGSGPTVSLDDTPLINYTGKFLDGTIFSSSDETGGAITIPLAHTIPGFQKGITGMHQGEKRRLYIHPDEGYGATAGQLPPNSLLIFEIEVVESNHIADADIDDSDVDNDSDIDNSDVDNSDVDDSDVVPASEDVDNSDVDPDDVDKMQE